MDLILFLYRFLNCMLLAVYPGDMMLILDIGIFGRDLTRF
jgi:hypothetical protein